MHPLTILAAILTGAYRILTAFAGWSQTRAQEIQYWAAISMVISGLAIAISAGLLIAKVSVALYILIIGLLTVHILTINNGLKMHGKITPSHHIVRLMLSLLIVSLAILGMR